MINAYHNLSDGGGGKLMTTVPVRLFTCTTNDIVVLETPSKALFTYLLSVTLLAK